jgi:alkyl hydroperoxide reductase subunit AhpC
MVIAGVFASRGWKHSQPSSLPYLESPFGREPGVLRGDPELKIAKRYDMLAADAGETAEGRTPAQNAPVRTVFVIGPDKRIKLTIAYPMSTGRNFDEILRVLDSIQLTTKHKVSTPANWTPGEDIIISGAVSNEEADKLFPGYKTVKPYLRTAAQPK